LTGGDGLNTCNAGVSEAGAPEPLRQGVLPRPLRAFPAHSRLLLDLLLDELSASTLPGGSTQPEVLQNHKEIVRKSCNIMRYYVPERLFYRPQGACLPTQGVSILAQNLEKLCLDRVDLPNKKKPGLKRGFFSPTEARFVLKEPKKNWFFF
jgi:hypothetical protein